MDASLNKRISRHKNAPLSRPPLKMEGESEYAVITFFIDGKFSTCFKRHKVNDQVGLFIVGNEVSIQWTLKKVEKRIVVFADGK